MTYGWEGDTLFARRGESVLGSIKVLEADDSITLYDLELTEGIPSGVGAMIGFEATKKAKGRTIYISVEAENQKALRFYASAGFRITHLVLRKEQD